jgi:hypothetical protein
MTEAVECKGISVYGSIKPVEHGDLDSWVGEAGSRLYTGCRSQLEAKTSQTVRVEPAMEADLAYSGGIRCRFFGGIRRVRGLVVVGGYLGL